MIGISPPAGELITVRKRGSRLEGGELVSTAAMIEPEAAIAPNRPERLRSGVHNSRHRHLTQERHDRAEATRSMRARPVPDHRPGLRERTSRGSPDRLRPSLGDA